MIFCAEDTLSFMCLCSIYEAFTKLCQSETSLCFKHDPQFSLFIWIQVSLSSVALISSWGPLAVLVKLKVTYNTFLVLCIWSSGPQGNYTSPHYDWSHSLPSPTSSVFQWGSVNSKLLRNQIIKTETLTFGKASSFRSSLPAKPAY